MVQGQNVDLILLDSVDDTVATDNDFSDILVCQLWNNPPQARMSGQAVGGAEDPVGEDCREWRRIPCYEETDGLEVIGCLGSPPLLEPFRHSAANLFLGEKVTSVRLAKAILDLVEKVKPVQGIPNSGVVRKAFNGLQNLLLGFHGNSPFTPYPSIDGPPEPAYIAAPDGPLHGGAGGGSISFRPPRSREWEGVFFC